MVFIGLCAPGLPEPIWASWRFIDLFIHWKKKPSKAHLAQHGFYKRLAHPGYEVTMSQSAQKAVLKFGESFMLETLNWPLGLDWLF